MLGSSQESFAIPGTHRMSQRDMEIVMANLDMGVAHWLKAEPTKPSTLAKGEKQEKQRAAAVSV